ncbi:hypothetical protein ACFSC6_03335 [Rufibacter sediminis]|uniref:Uncharacterized protein n=1 Tax=Rufibacter sediminis TaxID=2762756 RepID=A0ABR6VVI0_9BACT|nr:hypothetical protein [Rufibacter sediminis]MBC3541189.1 hypothetical protein [Rufibacter sediminis]
MSLIYSLLQKSKEEEKPVTLRVNAADGTKLHFGYLLDHNEDTVSLRSISQQGLPNGILIIRTSDLFGVDFDDVFLRRLEVKETNLRKLYADTTVPAIFHIGNCSMEEILHQAQKEGNLIYLNFYQDLGLYGFIKEITETEFLMEVYNPYGQYDGLSVQLIENIKNINWDDEDTRIVRLLAAREQSAR